MRMIVSLYTTFILSFLPAIINASAAGSFGGRHSYSLTTFDPSGNLDQVVRAIRASTLGVPIVALCLSGDDECGQAESDNGIPSSGGIYIAVPLRFLSTSPFVIDDGTPRIVPLTPSLCLTHTGIGADGRALSDVAIKLALDYRYLYGEDIGVQDLLAGLSSKMQEMTMKVGSRPYGCALLVLHLGDGGRNSMYRVDPSGAVVLLSSFCDDVSEKTKEEGTIKSMRRSVTLMGNWESLKQKKYLLQQQLEKQLVVNEDQIQDLLVNAARQTFTDEEDAIKLQKNGSPVLFAAFNPRYGLCIRRVTS